ncbi:hypothetical protein PR048_012895 [Dryococelus australis]|uniref:Uncharacterized protein n=1 Tax=Dryococelus australis TaxID=614101 RepID=A0ABQ9HQN0_9NEOP|nr:hypothetical protein PR048_012895 [Dryococelus australis]
MGSIGSCATSPRSQHISCDTTGISQELEKFLVIEKLSQFITSRDVWNGDVRDTSLFKFSKHMISLVTKQPGIGVKYAAMPSGYSPSQAKFDQDDTASSEDDPVPLESLDERSELCEV